MNERAARLLRRHGWEPGTVLGSGMEGTVINLSDDQVAKIWHGRSRGDVDLLKRFGAALEEGALPFRTPRVLELLQDGDLVISIERKVHGRSLAARPDPAPPLVDAEATLLLGEVLEGLTQVTISPDLAALPILPGDQPFDWLGSFSDSLADLVERRFQASPELLRHALTDSDALVAAIAARLRALSQSLPAAVLHGDLTPANVLVDGGRLTGVLDFGFLTTVGDPHFDAALTASLFDMYGPNARLSENLLSQYFMSRFGHDPDRYALYRAAYAIVTYAYFGSDGADGHFRWCVQMLRREDVTGPMTG